jgi:hypothetical protein
MIVHLIYHLQYLIEKMFDKPLRKKEIFFY